MKPRSHLGSWSEGPFPAGWILGTAAVALLAWSPPARGDLLHLKSGVTMDIGWTYRVSDGKVHVTRPEGTVAISMADVDRIEKTERREPPKDVERVSPPARGKDEAPEDRSAAVDSPAPGPPQDAGPVAQFRKDLLALSDRALGVTEEAGKAESPSPEEIRRWGDQARDCNRRVRAIQEALERGDDPPEGLLDVVGDLSAALAELEEALAGGDIDRARDVEARLRDVQEALLREAA